MKTTIPLKYFLSNTEVLLKKIVENNTSIEVQFDKKTIIIALSKDENKLKDLKRHEGCIVGDPEDIVHIDWSGEWRNDIS